MNFRNVKPSKNFLVDDMSFIMAALHGPHFDMTKPQTPMTPFQQLQRAIFRAQMLNPKPPIESPLPQGQILNGPVPGYTPYEVPFPTMYAR
jgi:hypothetical protein